MESPWEQDLIGILQEKKSDRLSFLVKNICSCKFTLNKSIIYSEHRFAY